MLLLCKGHVAIMFVLVQAPAVAVWHTKDDVPLSKKKVELPRPPPEEEIWEVRATETQRQGSRCRLM